MAFDVWGFGSWIDTRMSTGHRRAASFLELVPFSYISIWSENVEQRFNYELVAGKPISNGSPGPSFVRTFAEWQAVAPPNSGGWYPDW